MRFPPAPPADLVDRFIINTDRALRALTGQGPTSGRLNPADPHPEARMSEGARRHAAGLMRVDHAGEVAAQALYHGQSLTARDPDLRRALERSAIEENDHLQWCRGRLGELGAKPSVLDPLWYAGSFAMGTLAGVAGDPWSLGFLAETERQVVEHLDGHLQRLPEGDERSRAILEQMREDEGHHATLAVDRGAAELPAPVKRLMKGVAALMTTVAYRV